MLNIDYNSSEKRREDQPEDEDSGLDAIEE
jgi:hypothetical protein